MKHLILLPILYVVPIILLIITYKIWKKYGKDYDVVDTLEFYPPDNLNSLELAYALKGKVSKKDVISLIIYLASKGYIKIIENNNSFIILKEKDYDGDNIYEKIFFDNLFSDSKYSTVYNAYQTTPKDLFNKFYKTINLIKRKINLEKKHFVFEKTFFKSLTILMLIIIALSIIVIVPRISYYGFYKINNSFEVVFKLSLLYIIFFIANFPYYIKVFINIFLSFTIMVSSNFFYIKDVIYDNSSYLLGFVIGIICVILMFIFLDNMIKRSKYNSQLLGKIYGFKKFLGTAEKPRIEALIKQDPNYFYKIMPYVYVLNISNKWIKKFEKISYQMPEFYNQFMDTEVKKVINVIDDLFNKNIQN